MNWLRQSGAELLAQHLVHDGGRQRRRGLLQLGQRGPVGRGDLLGQRGLEDGQRLAELHGPALELPEDLEHLGGGAGLQFRRDHLGRLAAEPLPDAEGGASGDAQRQGRQARRADDRAARDVGHGPSLVPPDEKCRRDDRE